ncbi:MAG: hypothetical protein ACK5LC_14880, partial [Coprobacillaceae bacterium]
MKTMQYDFIGIEEANIYGINYPRIVVLGSISLVDYKFILKADDKEIPFNIRIYAKKDGFCIEADLNKSMKNVSLYVVTSDEEMLVCQRNNSFGVRVKSKLRKPIKKIGKKISGFFKKIKELFILVGKGIRLLWREHHFIVPVSMWGHYWHKLTTKLKILKDGHPFYEIYNQQNYLKWLS